MKTVKFGLSVCVGCVALSSESAAFAQTAGVQTTATTTTTTTTPVAAPVVAPAPADAPAPAQTGMALPGMTPDAALDATDHARVVGHFGVGYMGRRTITIDPTNGNTQDAPIIGIRYWLDPLIGIDAGLGLLMSGGSVTTGGNSTDTQGFTIFMIHGGVPLALAGSRHFSFQIVPELNLGIASSNTGGAAGSDLSGLHLDIGARAGSEIQFGFIGIPELSLQAGVGLALAYDRAKISPPNGAPTTSVSRTTLGTSVGDNPWNIFTGNIAALYYFD